MDLVLRTEVEDVLEEVIVEEIQDNHIFVTGSLVQVRERILCICHLYEVRDNSECQRGAKCLAKRALHVENVIHCWRVRVHTQGRYSCLPIMPSNDFNVSRAQPS